MLRRWCAAYECQICPLSENNVMFTSYSVTAGCTQEVQNTYISRVNPASLLNSLQIVFCLPQIELEELQYSINCEILFKLTL